MKLQSNIRDFLKREGKWNKLPPLCKWVHVTTAGRLPGSKYTLAPKGTPDVMAMTLRGKMMFFEVKGEGDTLTDEQLTFLEWHAARDYLAIVARSVQDVEDAMRRLGYL